MFGLLLFLPNIYYSNAVDAVPGKNVTLTCPVSIGAWMKLISGDWRELTNDAKYENVDTSQLTIRNVDVTDSGQYSCFCTRKCFVIYLNISVVTSISTVFECPFSSSNYEWKRYIKNEWISLPTNDGKYGNVNTNQLTIFNVDVVDNGQYSCTPKLAEDIFLYVIVMPLSVNVLNQTYLATIGGNITIDCNITGHPFASDIWWTESKGIRLNGTRYSGGNKPNPSLTIKNVIESDTGQYTCHATNTAGTNSQSTQLQTGYKPLVKSIEENIQASVGEDVILHCSFDSYPEPTDVSWTKDGNNLNVKYGKKYNGSTITIPSLTIYNVNNTDSGVYACYVENSFGRSFGRYVKLAVQEPSKSSSTIGAIAGGISVGIVAVVLVVVMLYIYTIRKWANNGQNSNYETRDNARVELHFYDEANRLNLTHTMSPVYVNTSIELTSSQNDMDTTFTTYDAQDFMRILQDKSSLSRNIRQDYEVLTSMSILRAASVYENVNIKTGATIVDEYTNKALIKKHDDGSGYIITTVPDQNVIDSFWTMITNYHVGYIVLLLQEVEKICEFFPNTIEPINTQSFKVEICAFEKLQYGIFEFVLDISNKDKKTVQQVKLYKITDWKVGHIHPSIDAICELLNVMRRKEIGLVALTGCFGVGFPVCGILGVCHEVLHAINNNKDFNMLQIAVQLKQIKADLFQTCEEYNLCYKVISRFLQNEHTYAVSD